jgi:hypothetical protein
MSMTVIIVLNLVMSLLALGAVAAVLLVARLLQPVSADEEGRAGWRGPSHHRLMLPAAPAQAVI